CRRVNCQAPRSNAVLEEGPRTSKSASKHPQSAAAKNALGVLQDLVPNGTKAMLEKAINYVKFLQIQVKVIDFTENSSFSLGGKAADVAQVKQAIHFIFSTRGSRNI
ncbi:unnamed protein product, partial [Musa textilis]